MTPEQYEKYWENAAKNHKSILHTDNEKHFLTYGLETFLSDLKDVDSPLVALEDPEYRPVDNLSDNVMLQMSGAVLIIKKCQTGDFAQVEAAKKEMFVIAFDFVTKLQNDRRKAFDALRPDPENCIKHLVLGSIEMIPVGPVFDGWHGWRVNHIVLTNKSPQLINANWNNETAWTG